MNSKQKRLTTKSKRKKKLKKKITNTYNALTKQCQLITLIDDFNRLLSSGSIFSQDNERTQSSTQSFRKYGQKKNFRFSLETNISEQRHEHHHEHHSSN